MIRRKQLFRHRPDEGQIGDCWRTCIACLLDKEPNDVPHFVEHCWNDSAKGNENAKAYLATQGLSFVETPYAASLEEVLKSVASVNPGTLYLLGGNSRSGCGHSVIARDEVIVWDPSQDDAGIVGPMDDGYFWVTWLVPAILMREAA